MATSLARLNTLVDFINTTASDLGILGDGERVVMEEGSPTYGRAFRLHLTKPGESGYFNSPFVGYLGATKAEADLSLQCIASTLQAVINLF